MLSPPDSATVLGVFYAMVIPFVLKGISYDCASPGLHHPEVTEDGSLTTIPAHLSCRPITLFLRKRNQALYEILIYLYGPNIYALPQISKHGNTTFTPFYMVIANQDPQCNPSDTPVKHMEALIKRLGVPWYFTWDWEKIDDVTF